MDSAASEPVIKQYGSLAFFFCPFQLITIHSWRKSTKRTIAFDFMHDTK